MSLTRVPLCHTPGYRAGWLRAVRGSDELAVEDSSTATAIELLDSVLAPGPDGSPAPAGVSLTSADRDRLLASLYRGIYGARVESTVQCSACGEPFDLDFSLDDLVAELGDGEVEAPADGFRKVQALPPFRLPTGADELMVTGLSPEDASHILVERCLGRGLDDESQLDGVVVGEVEAAMATLAPLVALELDARCPACEAVQQVQFDIQTFFLAALSGERDRLLRDVHTLASAYGWARGEILALGRFERRRLVALAAGEDRAWWA